MSIVGGPNRRQFGPFELDLRTGELYRQGQKVRLQEQAFQALALLVEQQGDLVSRQELREKLWTGDTYVDFDQGLNNVIKRLRVALSDSADEPCYVETLPRRGYRFIAKVTVPQSCTEVQSMPSTRLGDGDNN